MTLTQAEIAQMRADLQGTVMDHTCVIQRITSSGNTPYNTPVAPTWGAHLTALACRYWVPNKREVVGPNIIAVVGDARLIVPVATDVTERDRILSVTDIFGTAVGAVHNILSVVRRDAEIELVLEAVHA